MENNSLSSFNNDSSRHVSAPSSQELVDNENNTTASLDESLSAITTNNNNNNKVKFMCSYGGTIQFRAHDNHLAYVGGETKIVTVDRNIKFSAILAKLSLLCNSDVLFKYQLPGEDLDALISVTTDEDLEHMMVEYDQNSHSTSAKASRLRLFLFSPKSPAPASFASNNLKPEQQWFVDALNSVHLPHVDGSSPSVPTVSAGNPDFLFGLDSRYSVIPAPNSTDSVLPPDSTVPQLAAKESPAGSDGGLEDRQVVGGDPAMSPPEIEKQIEELKNLHLAGNNEKIVQPESNDGNGKVNSTATTTTMEAYNYSQKSPEKPAPPSPPSAPTSLPLSPAVFLHERQMTSTTGYPPLAASSATVTEQPVYLIATPAVMYHTTTLRAMNGPVSHQPYYGVTTRMVPTGEFFNNGAPPQPASFSLSHSHSHHSQSRIGANVETSTGMVVQQPKVGIGEPGYAQVVYDNSGRQVYISAPTWGGVVTTPYQDVGTGLDGPQSGGNSNGGAVVNQDGKVSKAASAV